jgi:hypothetical protein
MSEQYRQSTLNLYDSANKTELFQVKSLESKATITSSKEIAFHNEKMSIKNYSIEGEVLDEVADVVAEFRSNQSAIATETEERQAAVSQATEQMEAAVASEAVLRTEAVNALDIQLGNETTERNNQVDALDVAITNEATNRATEISETKAELEAKVSAEKARIDLILEGADIALDSFKEIVDYSNSINSERLDQITAVSNNLAAHNQEFEKLKQIVIQLAPDAASHFA